MSRTIPKGALGGCPCRQDWRREHAVYQSALVMEKNMIDANRLVLWAEKFRQHIDYHIGMAEWHWSEGRRALAQEEALICRALLEVFIQFREMVLDEHDDDY